MRNRNFDEDKQILYLVATPIGNLSELSSRAQEILANVSAVGCEDTRVTSILLTHFGIKQNLISCHEHNEEQASLKLLQYLGEGKNIAYVSDAGYPGISDPGERLAKKALELGYKVSVVSGPSALLSALLASGLDTTHFYFHGFLNSKHSQRLKELETLKDKTETMIFYEAPHRIKDTLEDLLKVFGNRKATLARELTKRYEEYIRMDLKSLLELDDDTLKGEMVLVIAGATPSVSNDLSEAISYAKSLIQNGEKTKDAAKKVQEKFKISKNIIYQELIK